MISFLYITDNIDLETLASLCQEYKIDWLLKKIEKFVENVPLMFSSCTEKLLKYLKLSSLYGFQKAMEKLVQVIDESFITLQMYEEFTWLNTSAKILLARKRLWKMLPHNEREKVMNTNGFALLSVFGDFKQEEFNFESPEQPIFAFDSKDNPENRSSRGKGD